MYKKDPQSLKQFHVITARAKMKKKLIINSTKAKFGNIFRHSE